MNKVIAAVIVAIISLSPVYAATAAVEAVPPSAATSPEQMSRDMEDMRNAVRAMLGELAKNKALLREMTREMLNEASRNKELLKEVIRGIAKNRETIKTTIKDLIADKEIQKALREDRELIKELLDELSKPEPPAKTNDDGKR